MIIDYIKRKMNEKELMELVNQAIAKDNQAMETLYKNYYKDVLFVCKKLNLNDADANDIAQDAFIDAFSKLNSLNDPTKFKQWICRIANNKALNLLKHNNVLKFENIDDDNSFYEIPDKEISAEQQVIDNEVAETLKKIIEKLPLEQRITVFMYYYEDMSVKEIALAYNVSENTVRSRLNYAKKFISSEINKLEDKGIKLRSTAILPFLYLIFAQEEKAFAASILASTIPSASTVIAKVMKDSVANATTNGASAITSTAGTSSVAEITATTTAKVATTAAKTGFSLGKIIAISATSVAVVTAAIIGISSIRNKDDDKKDNDKEVVSLEDKNDKEDKENKEDNTENPSFESNDSQSNEDNSQNADQEEEIKTGDEYWDYYTQDQITLPEISYNKIEYLQGADGPISANIADTIFNFSTETITEKIKNTEYFKSKNQEYIFTTELYEECTLSKFSDVGLQKQFNGSEIIKAYPKSHVDEVTSTDDYRIYDFDSDFDVILYTDYTNYNTPDGIRLNFNNIDITREEQKKIFSYLTDILDEDLAKYLVYAGTDRDLEEDIYNGNTTYALTRTVDIGEDDEPQSGKVSFIVSVSHSDELGGINGESYYTGNYVSALNPDLSSLDKYILGNFGSTNIFDIDNFGSEYMKHGLEDVYVKTVNEGYTYSKDNYPDGTVHESFRLNTKKGCDETALILCPEFDVSIDHYSKNNETTDLRIDFNGGIGFESVPTETEPDYTKLYTPLISKLKALLGNSVDISAIDMSAFIDGKDMTFESTYLGKPCSGTISYEHWTSSSVGLMRGEYGISISMKE